MHLPGTQIIVASWPKCRRGLLQKGAHSWHGVSPHPRDLHTQWAHKMGRKGRRLFCKGSQCTAYNGINITHEQRKPESATMALWMGALESKSINASWETHAAGKVSSAADFLREKVQCKQDAGQTVLGCTLSSKDCVCVCARANGFSSPQTTQFCTVTCKLSTVHYL